MFFGATTVTSTRLPQMTPRASEVERRESQIQDPYPDRDLGPDVGFRPRGFEEQRPEIQRTKDRSYSAFLRSQARQTPPPPDAPVYPPALPAP